MSLKTLKRDLIKEIKKCMIDADLNNTRLSEMMNTSRQNISNILIGNGSVGKLLEILELLGYDLEVKVTKNNE